jgi:hypothetical protein
MILGIKSFALAARTVVPAAGLLILLGTFVPSLFKSVR